MNFSAPFIRRPVATCLLAIGLLIAGIAASRFLAVSSLPSVDIPTIVIFAPRPGADSETMATSVAAPIERRLGEISGVSEMTSIILGGTATIIVAFDVSRDIDGAAHDVQAALNAAANDLPSDLPTRPYFRKFNPADMPVLTIALTSDTLSLGQVYDIADSVLGQRLSQIEGVSQVQVNGADKPAVRVRLDPTALAADGLSGQNVYDAIRAANVAGPLGGFDGPDRAETIGANGSLRHAEDYKGLVLKQFGNATVTLADVASVVDATANSRVSAWSGRKPAILLTISKAANANVIETVDGVKAVLPLLRSWMPPEIKLDIVSDRTATIRAGISDAELTLLITIALVLMVVFLFMRRAVPTIAAGAAVPLSIAGTLASMWFLGFAIDNFSLMALTISVGFVVDDSIVMIENIVRHIEQGETPMQAALNGARQIGFTVVSISVSLVAVFIPLLFMGGIVGRLFHEFATTLTLAIVISALVSLTLAPMLCGNFMRSRPGSGMGSGVGSGGDRAARWPRADRAAQLVADGSQAFYAATLGWALRRRGLMVASTIAAMALTIAMYVTAPASLLPPQDTGLLEGITVADPSVSFQAMADRQREVVDVLMRDPAIATVSSQIGVTAGFNSLNRGSLAVSLKPLAERGLSAEQVLARLRPELAAIGGVETFLDPTQDLRGGTRQGGVNQFVLLDQDFGELRDWTAKLEEKLRAVDAIADISSDQDLAGPQVDVVIDRIAAARLGLSVAAIDNALNNAYTQRQSSVIYTDRNQYFVVLEVDPALQVDPTYLDRIFVGAAGGRQIPLGAVAHVEHGTAPVIIRHQGQFPAATIYFDAAPNVPMGTAMARVQQAALDLHMPPSVITDFAGNAKFLTDSLASQPMLIGAAFLSIYIVLGVLYESLTQPITIISTLPSAGLGALLALRITGHELSIVAIIGILLLMGIVKKNAIMLVDFALEQERRHGMTPAEAIHAACLARFRPIMMTTLAALMGALPLAFSFGTGAELRQPLGISIAGGLIVSQALTLYTTPAVYLALQRRRLRRPRWLRWAGIVDARRDAWSLKVRSDTLDLFGGRAAGGEAAD